MLIRLAYHFMLSQLLKLFWRKLLPGFLNYYVNSLQKVASGSVHEKMCQSLKWKWQLLDNVGVLAFAFRPLTVTKSWWVTLFYEHRHIPYEEEWENYQHYFSFKIDWAIVRNLHNYPHKFFKELFIIVDISGFLRFWFKVNDDPQALMINFTVMFCTVI